MRRALLFAQVGWVALVAVLTVVAGCDSGDDGGAFEPVDVVQDVETAGGDVSIADDAFQPPLGEPEWRLVTTAEIDPGEESWRDVHGVLLDGGGWVTAVVGTNGTVALYESTKDAWSFRNVGAAVEVLSVWVEDRDSMLVVGQSGLARRWDASLGENGDWLISNILGQEVDLYDIWGNRGDAQWVCGDRGIVARWDELADRWDVKLFPGNELTGGAKLESIWGTSPSEVFAVGNRIIIRWNGADWERMDPGAVHLRDVWGTRDGPVFAVGEGGSILALDRETNTWNTEQVGFLPYWSIYGIDAENVYVGALNSGTAQLTANGWEIVFIESRPGSPPEQLIPRNLRFVSIWGTSPDNLFLISNGSEIVRRGRFAIR